MPNHKQELIKWINLAIDEEFRLTTRELLKDPLIIKKISKKFNEYDPRKIAFAIREIFRQFSVSEDRDSWLFFPGNKLVDQVWHFFIVETALYRRILKSLGITSFIDHTGIEYEDYISKRTPEEIHEEQFSWVATYIYNFKQFDKESYELLPLAKEISERLGLDREGLNVFGKELIKKSDYQKNINLNSWKGLKKQLLKDTIKLDNDTYSMNKAINLIANYKKQNKSTIHNISNEELKDIFYVSPCLGFTIWQDLAAYERLKHSLNWIKNNQEVWEIIKAGEKVGLGITHIFKPESPLKGKITKSGDYIINGYIPWMSGFDYFKYYVIGFIENENVIITLLDVEDIVLNAEISTINLESMNATSSIGAKFKDFKVDKTKIISVTKVGENSKKYVSQYLYPELGLINRLVDEITANIEDKKTNEKYLEIDTTIQKIKHSINTIVSSNSYSIDIDYLKVEIIYKLSRLLTISEGSKALNSKGLAHIYARQILLFDVFIQPKDLIIKKVKGLV